MIAHTTKTAAFRGVLFSSRECLLDPLHRQMTSVLDLDPIRRAAAAVGAIAPLGDHILNPTLWYVASATPGRGRLAREKRRDSRGSELRDEPEWITG